MTLVLHFFRELWLLLKAVPWQVYTVLGLVVAVLWWGNHKYNAGYDDAAVVYEARIEAEREYIAREKLRLEAEFAKIEKNLLEEQKKGYEKRDRIIADWKSGRLRLKTRFSPTTCPTQGSDGGAETGFLDEDVQFLIRESSRADGIVQQLTACQGVINEYQKTSK